MKIYFLILTAFSNYLMGLIISGTTFWIVFYKEMKFQSARINSFCVADLWEERISGVFSWFYEFFTFCAALHSLKYQLLIQFSWYYSIIRAKYCLVGEVVFLENEEMGKSVKKSQNHLFLKACYEKNIDLRPLKFRFLVKKYLINWPRNNIISPAR